MKKTTKVLLSAILTIAMCVSVISGATFALFTSEAQTNIAVNAGKVRVNATIEGLVLTTSLSDYKDDTADYTFENGGEATINGGTLTLTNVTPGDIANFTIVVENESNVSIKYRVVMQAEGPLADVLKMTANTETITTEEKHTDWSDVVEAQGTIPSIAVKVELPAEVGNAYQGVDENGDPVEATNVTIRLEAVQANGTDLYGKTLVNTVKELKTALTANDDNIIALTEALTLTESIDLNGKTVEGNFFVENGSEVTVSNGTITNIDNTVSAIEINSGKLVLDNVNIESARHGVRVEGAATVEINGGTYKATSKGMTTHALNVSDGATVVINGGTFVGPAGTSADSGSAVKVQANSEVTIYGGNFYGGKNSTLSAEGTLIVKGGTFDQKPADAYVAAGYKAKLQSDGLYYVVPENANVILVPNDSTSSTPIQDAINNNATANTDEENIIYLADRTYAEDINLTLASQSQKSDIVFKAAPGTSPVIAGTVTLGYRDQGTGATKWNANVTFEGITFDASENGQNSIDVQDVKSLTLKNCKIIGDGETGITSARGNATGPSTIVGCTFENAGMQVLGQFGNGLVIDDCTFNNSCVNVQSGIVVTIQNSTFNNTLTDAHVDESFYAIRSNAIPINVKDCIFNIDSELAEVASNQIEWCLLWNRNANNEWTVENIEVNFTDDAKAQTCLMLAMTAKDGAIVDGTIVINGLTGNFDANARVKGNVTIQ